VNRARRRYYRTIFLGLAAMATLIWAAVDQFDIAAREMLRLFLVTVAAVGVVIVLSAVTAAIWIGLRRWLGRRDED